jgi:hypothetical protein
MPRYDHPPVRSSRIWAVPTVESNSTVAASGPITRAVDAFFLTLPRRLKGGVDQQWDAGIGYAWVAREISSVLECPLECPGRYFPRGWNAGFVSQLLPRRLVTVALQVPICRAARGVA